MPNTKRAGGMAQGVGPEFKPQYCKKKKKKVGTIAAIHTSKERVL
jgi:hypothetical protein